MECVYTLTILAQECAFLELDEEQRSLYRTFQYHPKWQQFFVAAMNSSISDEDVLALIPVILLEPTLHCDSGTALISLTKWLLWRRTACAKHLEPNIASLNHSLKEPAMALLYSKDISTNMAFDIRDSLVTAVAATHNLDSKAKKWILANFGTEDGMEVCTHTSHSVTLFLRLRCRSTHRHFAIFFFHLVIAPTLPWNCGSGMSRDTRKRKPILEEDLFLNLLIICSPLQLSGWRGLPRT